MKGTTLKFPDSDIEKENRVLKSRCDFYEKNTKYYIKRNHELYTQRFELEKWQQQARFFLVLFGFIIGILSCFLI